MRLLADENIPGEAVVALRAAGHDVAWIRGELAWHELLPAKSGIVLFPFPMPAPTAVGRVIRDIVNARAD